MLVIKGSKFVNKKIIHIDVTNINAIDLVIANFVKSKKISFKNLRIVLQITPNKILIK